MKSLDEVIKKIEKQWVCPSSDEADEYCELYEVREDALRYLQTYRADKLEWEQTKDQLQADYAEAIEKCARAARKHLDALKDLKWINDPLTWDELRQMGGKPVWVELLYHHPEQKYKYWDVIKRFDTVEGYDLIDLAQTGYLHKSLLNREWQAYRKERNEEN